MLRCKEVTWLIASGDLESSHWTRQLGVKMHLLLCKHCRLYWAQMKAIASLLRSIFRAPYSSEEIESIKRLEQRILKK